MAPNPADPPVQDASYVNPATITYDWLKLMAHSRGHNVVSHVHGLVRPV